MNKASAKAIDKQVTETLKRLDLYRAPVNVEAVAKGLGAKVVVEEMEGDVSGFLLLENNVATIAVNKRHHPNRQRFTIAHECGHLVLHKDQGDRLWLDKAYFYRDSNSSTGERLAEIQANLFAASLLMPEELVRSSLGGTRSISDTDVFKLALRFGVSEQAMTLRLAAVGIISV